MPRWFLGAGLIAVACVAAAGCRSGPDPAALGPFERVPVDAWPRLEDDLELDGLLAACDNALAYYDRVDPTTVYRFGGEERTARRMGQGLRRFAELVERHRSADERRRVLAAEFVLLRSRGRDGRGGVLFTGYYEPLLAARSAPGGRFRYPVLGVPSDLVTVKLGLFGIDSDIERVVGRVEDGRLVPYPDRRTIDFGEGLAVPAPALGYVADRVELFFLHVQGSGTLVFEDGSRLRAGYAAGNGRPYRSIGRMLIEEGLVPRSQMSMQAIKAYLASHPDDVERVLAFNPSYVFFRVLEATGGPLGCFDVPLTAGRAIATDRELVPAPAVTWVQGTMPTAAGGEGPIARFTINLDTGSSIQGPGRLDLFIGAGEEAGALAGRMQNEGRLYLLLPSEI